MVESLHTIHPMLVHFTIALLVTSSMLLLVGKIFINRPWATSCRTAGNWNLIIGALFSLVTVASGFQAFATVAHDAPSHLAMTEHRNLAVTGTILWCGLAVWRGKVLWQDRRSGWPFFTGVFLAFCLLIVTGSKGGNLVYHHGLGVASLPESSGEGHDHEHAPGEGHGSADTQPTADAGHGHDSSDGHVDAAVVEQPAQPVSDSGHGHDDTDAHPHEAVVEQPAQLAPNAGHAHDSNSKPHSH